MSRLQKLIDELCPAGVPEFDLSEVASIGTGARPDEKARDGELLFPFMNGGVKSSELLSESNTDSNTVVIPSRGSVGIVGFVRTAFWCGPLSYRIRSLDQGELHNTFLYYFLKSREPRIVALQQSGSIPALNKKELAQFRVSVPPLQVQEEIVRILDTFTELDAELEAELEARRTQYEEYRNQLLDFPDSIWRPLGEVVQNLRTGLNPRTNFKLNTPRSVFPYVTVRELGGFNIQFFDKTDKVDQGGLTAINGRAKLVQDDVLFSATGTIGRTALVPQGKIEFGIKEGVYALTLDHSLLLPRYFIHLVNSRRVRDELSSRAEGGTVKSISMKSLASIKIAVPEIAQQLEILKVLDGFEDLLNGAVGGLSRELALRKHQYEHYRNQLLTFKKAS